LLIVQSSKGVRDRKAKISNQKSAINKLQPPFGAIFDWDGVIIDSGALHAQSWRRLAAEIGRPIVADSFIRGFGMKSARIIEEIRRGIAPGAPAGRRTEVLSVVDRAEAIERAVAMAGAGDLVLVAGKGHEKYQQIGDRVLPFDDAAVAREALARRLARRSKAM